MRDGEPLQPGQQAARMDVVTVCFEREFSPLLLQARSLARSNARDVFGRYVIIWNDDTLPEVFARRHRPRLAAELDGAGLDWEVVPRAALLPDQVVAGVPGSRTQQALKLVASRLVRTDRYCVLDTKNHVIRPLAAEDLVAADGRMRSHRQSYPPQSPFGERLAASLAYFGLSRADTPPNQDLPTTTPYVLPSTEVRELISEVERRESLDFGTAFLCAPALAGTTEFLLWYAYLLSRPDAPLTRLYALQDRIYTTFFNHSPQGEAMIAAEIERLDKPHVKFLGVHRNRFSRLTAPERAAFTRVWMKAGLFATEEQSATFMDRVAIRQHVPRSSRMSPMRAR